MDPEVIAGSVNAALNVAALYLVGEILREVRKRRGDRTRDPDDDSNE